jgi:hypothetical protein
MRIRYAGTANKLREQGLEFSMTNTVGRSPMGCIYVPPKAVDEFLNAYAENVALHSVDGPVCLSMYSLPGGEPFCPTFDVDMGEDSAAYRENPALLLRVIEVMHNGVAAMFSTIADADFRSVVYCRGPAFPDRDVYVTNEEYNAPGLLLATRRYLASLKREPSTNPFGIHISFPKVLMTIEQMRCTVIYIRKLLADFFRENPQLRVVDKLVDMGVCSATRAYIRMPFGPKIAKGVIKPNSVYLPRFFLRGRGPLGPNMRDSETVAKRFPMDGDQKSVVASIVALLSESALFIKRSWLAKFSWSPVPDLSVISQNELCFYEALAKATSAAQKMSDETRAQLRLLAEGTAHVRDYLSILRQSSSTAESQAVPERVRIMLLDMVREVAPAGAKLIDIKSYRNTRTLQLSHYIVATDSCVCRRKGARENKPTAVHENGATVSYRISASGIAEVCWSSKCREAAGLPVRQMTQDDENNSYAGFDSILTSETSSGRASRETAQTAQVYAQGVSIRALSQQERNVLFNMMPAAAATAPASTATMATSHLDDVLGNIEAERQRRRGAEQTQGLEPAPAAKRVDYRDLRGLLN